VHARAQKHAKSPKEQTALTWKTKPINKSEGNEKENGQAHTRDIIISKVK